jgi:hypothetical protein
MLYSDLILAAAQQCGVVGSVETAFSNANDATVCLNQLNTMLDQWSSNNILIPSTDQTVLPLVPGKQQYLIGPNVTPPDYQTRRPKEIILANCISLANPAQPVRIPMQVFNVQERGSIPVDNVPSTITLGLWYWTSANVAGNGGAAAGTIFVWPNPTAAYQLEIFALYPLTQVLATDAVILQPGYQAALQDCLSLRLWSLYRGAQQPPMLLMKQAGESRTWIAQMNAPDYTLHTDPALNSPRRNTWLYTTGTYRT